MPSRLASAPNSTWMLSRKPTRRSTSAVVKYATSGTDITCHSSALAASLAGRQPIIYRSISEETSVTITTPFIHDVHVHDVHDQSMMSFGLCAVRCTLCAVRSIECRFDKLCRMKPLLFSRHVLMLYRTTGQRGRTPIFHHCWQLMEGAWSMKLDGSPTSYG